MRELAKILGITKPIPRRHLLQVKLSGKQISKLAKWQNKRADINIYVDTPRNQILLENTTALEKWERKQIREGHVVEV